MPGRLRSLCCSYSFAPLALARFALGTDSSRKGLHSRLAPRLRCSDSARSQRDKL
jgi:hypothetical protein